MGKTLPAAYAERMKKQLGDAFEAYEAALEEDPAPGLRVNPIKWEKGEAARRLGAASFSLRPVPWCGTGFFCDAKDPLSTHPYYDAGLYYLQEPTAMAPAAFLPVFPGEMVLDLCAAPGGKSTQLIGKLKGKGVLFSNDVSASRCKALLKNLENWGAENVVVLCEGGAALARRFPAFFDKILIDAPCSGEGMFRKKDSMGKYWQEHGPAYYQPIQRELLANGIAMLKPGGKLLYSTCTFSPMEDEENVSWLLEQYPEMRVIPMDCPDFPGKDTGHPAWARSDWEETPDESDLRSELSNAVRFWPHLVEGEGHFAVLFEKRAKAGYLESAGQTIGNADLLLVPENAEQQNPGFPSSPANAERQDKKKRNVEREKEKRGQNAGKADRRDPQARKKAGNNGIPEQAAQFLSRCGISIDPERLVLRGEQLLLLPEYPDNMPPLFGLRIMREGLLLGFCRKNRFEPSQALAMVLQKGQFDPVLSLSPADPRTKTYLRGESIEADGLPKGWVLICVEEFPLGWAKNDGEWLKNKRSPGWRRMD